MLLRRSWAIGRHEVRMLKDDPGTLVFLLLVPLLMMAVMKPLLALALQADGYLGASGAEQAVPGMATMFTAFTASVAGFGFFREHGWGTWDRLRASSATTANIMAGKLGPVLALSVIQMLGLFGLGIVLFDLQIAGSMTALLLIMVTFAVAMLGFGMTITALSRTSLQLNTFANLGGMVFAIVGGAMVPIAVLPGWVQTVAHLTPVYWAMQGFLGVVLEGEGVIDALPATLVLMAFAAVFMGIAALRFRFEETKVFYA